MDLDAGEVLDSLEGEIIVKSVQLDVVAEREQERLKPFEQILEVVLRLREHLCDRLVLSLRGFTSGGLFGHYVLCDLGIDQLKQQQVAPVALVAKQLDAAVDLLNSVLVVLREV